MRGSFWLLYLYDVAEQIDLTAARRLAGNESEKPKLLTPAHAPAYIGFENPPLSVRLASPVVVGENSMRAIGRAFDYGVLSVLLELPFEGDWDTLEHECSRLLDAAPIAAAAKQVATDLVGSIHGALMAPYADWLTEEYLVVNVSESDPLLPRHADKIAELVRGETQPLSVAERQEVLASSMSCYANDLLVVSWAVALVQDTPENARTTIQLLEYANSQLLEFRHYDKVLSDLLAELYKVPDQRRSWWRRWRLARDAERLNSVRLDVIELTERSDNALRLLGDMFYARAYRMVANRIGVDDYRKLVDEKLQAAGELYRFLVDEFNHQRAFVLEVMVVIILVIELVYPFLGIR